jgi:hypothetical protein
LIKTTSPKWFYDHRPKRYKFKPLLLKFRFLKVNLIFLIWLMDCFENEFKTNKICHLLFPFGVLAVREMQRINANFLGLPSACCAILPWRSAQRVAAQTGVWRLLAWPFGLIGGCRNSFLSQCL